MKTAVVLTTLLIVQGRAGYGAEPGNTEFKVFQFPRDRIPTIDGKTDDWNIVGEDYTYRTDKLDGTTCGYPDGKINTKDFDVAVRVGWVKGLNRLYFLYEAYNANWDFSRYTEKSGYQNDVFEIALDADRSGGPIILDPLIKDPIENHFRYSGVYAQNYHIFTPPINNQWCMVWGSNPWIAYFPWANQAYDYHFKPGESGKLVLEFWVTPFDYAPSDGPDRAVVSRLVEGQTIGLSWAILNFINGKKQGAGNCNLAHDRGAVQNASVLPAFKLMPLERRFLPVLQADFSFKVIDTDRGLVYFKDRSIGNISKWTWHFGDGTTSNERNPIHEYKEPGFHYNVLLEVAGPDGVSKYSKHWEVSVR